MIKSKSDYLYYLEADRIALGRSMPTVMFRIKDFFFPDNIWKFQRTLRKLEYIRNTKRGIIARFLKLMVMIRFRRLSIKLGFTIPPNVFGPGLSIAHYGTIIINDGTKIGKNCRLHACVNIGTAAGFGDKAPKLGDNVYIGPGAKLYGEISVASNTVIGANAVVNKSFEEENILIAGIPAKKLGPVEIDKIVINATELIRLGVNRKDLKGLTAAELYDMYLKEHGALNSDTDLFKQKSE